MITFRLLNLVGIFTLFLSSLFAQSTIDGQVFDENNVPLELAPVMLKSANDSSLVKGTITDQNGKFEFLQIPVSSYFVEVNYLGLKDYISRNFDIVDGKNKTIEGISMVENSKLMDEVTVMAKRSILEVKADRTVFNVQGTINATGQSGVNLLRKAPGIIVDNNNNITVLGRSGVLIYVDGKRLPLSGDDLTNYLQSLTSEQIDRIDIITNPGAKYEAQGNAGIIDIKLKKDENHGSNGTISSNINRGKYTTNFNANLNANYRNNRFNIFGNIGGYNREDRNDMFFKNFQSGIRTEESNVFENFNTGTNGRLGLDYFINKKSTIGFIIGLGSNVSDNFSSNKTLIYPNATSIQIDSLLKSPNFGKSKREQGTANLNYVYESGSKRLSFDLDYGLYNNKNNLTQPNLYYNDDEQTLRSSNLNYFTTPVKIYITTAKIDYETPWQGGNLSFGSKFSKVNTDNTFLYYNVLNGVKVLNDKRSNQFFYDENVMAGYVNYSKKLKTKWSMTSGLRVESTDAEGDLNTFQPDPLEDEPVKFDYVSYFPSAGLTYAHAPEHSWSLNYGRRINRPDYNVLNPFREQISELSYSKGNKGLLPEKVHNIELGYTFKYMYSFKVSYSKTDDQITRLIGPDEKDPRAGFISWDNLATQNLYNVSASLPFTINKWWSVYLNANASYTDNQATYKNGAKVDVQAGSYNLFQQSTFDIGKGFTAEVSGWYSGPGVWGGVFLFDPSYSLDLGLQKKFIKNKLNVRISAADVTFQSYWSGISNFNGLRGEGTGSWDSRRVALSLSYDLGNSKVKSRKRSTGLEEESKRVGG